MVNGILLCADISFLKFTPIRLFVNMLFIFYFIFFQQKAVDDDIGYNVNRKENVNRAPITKYNIFTDWYDCD